MKEIKNNIGILIAALLGGIGIGFLIGHHSKGATAVPEKKAGFDGDDDDSDSGSAYSNIPATPATFSPTDYGGAQNAANWAVYGKDHHGK